VSGIRGLISRRPRIQDSLGSLRDAYVMISEAELTLSYAIRRILEVTHEEQWWKVGVPGDIRKKCQERKEEDPDAVDDPFLYTMFIDYKKIIDQRWRFFERAVPLVFSKDKTRLVRALDHLNSIRNKVMHPVKPCAIDSETLRKLRNLVDSLELCKWRFSDMEGLYKRSSAK
jgi:hypothetical protein